MEAFWQVLINTPKWVYFLFFSFMVISIKASRTRQISVWKVFIMPAVTVYFSVSLFSSIQTGLLILSLFFAAFFIGGFLGYFQLSRMPLRVDHQKKRIEMPGTWSTLVIFLIIFGTKYFFNYKLAVAPYLAHEITFEAPLLFISGVTTGFIFGKLFLCLYRIKKGPYVYLS